MMHRHACPLELHRKADCASRVAFRVAPEASTEGGTEAEALAESRECLIAALGGYVRDGCTIQRLDDGAMPVRAARRSRFTA